MALSRPTTPDRPRTRRLDPLLGRTVGGCTNRRLRARRRTFRCDGGRSARCYARWETTEAPFREGVPDTTVGIEEDPVDSFVVSYDGCGDVEARGAATFPKAHPGAEMASVASPRAGRTRIVPPLSARRNDVRQRSESPTRLGIGGCIVPRVGPIWVALGAGAFATFNSGTADRRTARRARARPGRVLRVPGGRTRAGGGGGVDGGASPPDGWMEPKREPNEERRKHVDARGNYQQEPGRDQRDRPRRARWTDRPVGSGEARAWRVASERNRDQSDQPHHEQDESRCVDGCGASSWTHRGTAYLSRKSRWR